MAEAKAIEPVQAQWDQSRLQGDFGIICHFMKPVIIHHRRRGNLYPKIAPPQKASAAFNPDFVAWENLVFPDAQFQHFKACGVLNNEHAELRVGSPRRPTRPGGYPDKG